MSDWYNDAQAKMMAEFAEETGLSPEQAQDAYAFLSYIGLIDYDIEKDVLYDTYVGDA